MRERDFAAKKRRESGRVWKRESEYGRGAMRERKLEKESAGLREKARMKEVIQKNEKGRYKNWRREFTKTEMEGGRTGRRRVDFGGR